MQNIFFALRMIGECKNRMVEDPHNYVNEDTVRDFCCNISTEF